MLTKVVVFPAQIREKGQTNLRHGRVSEERVAREAGKSHIHRTLRPDCVDCAFALFLTFGKINVYNYITLVVD